MERLSLTKRFEAFVATLDQFESIDFLLQESDPVGRKRADYLIENRQFIIEQKVLISDPVGRPQKFVDKLSIERGFRFYGTLSSDYIFSRQPDPKNLQRRMILDLARGIDDIVANADKQTADTRVIFNIPEAAGILVILNEGAGQLRPDVIHYALCNSFQKKTREGALRYAANDGVLLISEANSLVASGAQQTQLFPVLYFRSPEKRHDAVATAFSESLIKRWADFNNAPLITVPVDVNLKPRSQ